jgi:rfaE bifunctional protein nucleotidyltransferase chain/domain
MTAARPLTTSQSSPAPLRARDKIMSVDELAAQAEKARARGKTVVLAHGVFDLLHMGHMRHLEGARREGDLLFVTCTADRYVNKGPGRPVFPEQFRAEMLAALECVDGVAVSNWPTAEGVIRLLQPGVYIKGGDYENPNDDLTGKIQEERRAVEAHGGRIVFTNDITFSSSALINRHLSVFDPQVSAYLGERRDNGTLDRALAAIDAIKNQRVLVVGDAIIDEYQYAVPMGKSAKENIIASKFESRELFAGGVIAAANHVADFCAEVELVTVLGDNESHEDVIRAALRSNVKLHVVTRAGKPTTRKSRFVDPGHMRKLFEVYTFDDTPVDGAVERELCGLVRDLAPGADTTIVTDFGHGMMTPAAIRATTETARFMAVNAQSNSANHGYNLITKYDRADYVCIDAPEARLAMADKRTELGELIAGKLRTAVGCDHIIVTHGANGCVAFEPQDGVHRVPAFTRQVVDTVGAGDAFLAITSPLVSAGVPLDLVGLIGNAVGAIKVGIVGHRRSVEKVPVMKFLTALLK